MVFAVLLLIYLRLIHPSKNLVDCAVNGYVTQFFLSRYFAFSLLWKLENNVLTSFISPVVFSDLVISLSVLLSVLSLLNNFLSSLFLFNLLLSSLPVLFCFLFVRRILSSLLFFSTLLSVSCSVLFFSFHSLIF